VVWRRKEGRGKGSYVALDVEGFFGALGVVGVEFADRDDEVGVFAGHEGLGEGVGSEEERDNGEGSHFEVIRSCMGVE
jgi:hypothetical protein